MEERVKGQVSISEMALEWILLAEINDRAVESAEQDQTAHMCRLTLLCTVQK